MLRRATQHHAQVFDIRIDRTRDERRLASDRYRNRVDRIVDRTHRRGLSPLAQRRRRRILPFREAVNTVVEQNDVNIEVSADSVHQVIAADAQSVAIAGDHPSEQVGANALQPRREGRSAAMDRVQPVGVHVVRKAARTADARDEHGLLAWDANLGQHLLHLCQNRIIATARTPPDVLVAGEVRRLENRQGSRG